MNFLSKFLVPTENEIAANHAGLNTFFGAVLGFVMAGTERLDSMEFAYVLTLVSGIVISILYISASRQTILYSFVTVALILVLPRIIDPIFEAGEALPEKLQPTLMVWTLLSVFVELLPRRQDGPDETPADI